MGRAISPSVVLAAWERAYGYGPVGKGLALLTLAVPDETPARLAEFTIGARDNALLKLRSELFGNDLQCVVSCTECSSRVEIRFAVRDLCLAPTEVSEDALSFESRGRRWHLKLPTSADLIAVEPLPADHVRRQALLERCLVPVGAGNDAIDEPANETVQAAIELLANADPQANIQLAVECPDCGHNWSSRFDIVNFLWAEIDAWARRLLSDVHVLARSYGWREPDILAMSSWRRQVYLEMARR